MSGIDRIVAERKRQIEVEGWTPEHDDNHDGGQLYRAAALYCLVEYERQGDAISEEAVEFLDDIWPWRADHWKPSPDNRIKELVKAGALIAAEIDRLERLEP